VHFVEKSAGSKSDDKDSLQDLVSGKMFLQKYKGVKAKMQEQSVKEKMEQERLKRTFGKPLFLIIS